MVAALKGHTVPSLRVQGFKGSFPHFFREQNDFISLLSVQFFSSGGSFCVELGYADPNRSNVYFRPDAAPSKMRVSATRDRMRLGAPDGGDHWFHFGLTTYGDARGSLLEVNALAREVSARVVDEGEPWWRTKASTRS